MRWCTSIVVPVCMLLPQVETLGDAVYMVAGGVPDRSAEHAISVAGLALELQEKALTIVEPCFLDYKLNTRIGQCIQMFWFGLVFSEI